MQRPLSDRPPGSPRKCTTATGAGWGRGGMRGKYARGRAGGALAGCLAGWAAGALAARGRKLPTKSVASDSLPYS